MFCSPSDAVSWWRRRSPAIGAGLLAGLAAAILSGVYVWVQQRPPQPDVERVHSAIRV